MIMHRIDYRKRKKHVKKKNKQQQSVTKTPAEMN